MAPDSTGTRIARLFIVFVGTFLAAAVGWFLFAELTGGPTTFGVLLILATTALGARLAGRVASAWFATYDVAEVGVEGPITRDGRGLPTRPGGTSADAVVEQIARADADANVEALLLRLNTPGGQVIPSDDVRLAAERFDGPTVAYATDVCASGGYWIASGCDALFARDASVVGSIGVVGSRINATELAEKLGLSYERFAAGRFKDAGSSLREIDDEERTYLQGLVDDYYEHFVDRVTDGRDIDAEAVRDTEARVYLGEEALDLGLVDRLGTHEDVEAWLAERLDVDEVAVSAFEPTPSVRARLNLGAQRVAYAFGAGLASVVGGERFEFEL